MKYIKECNIKKFYAYKEKPRDRLVVEFGWIPTRFLRPSRFCVIATSPEAPEEDNAATLDDYRQYFSRLARCAPEEFLSRWTDDESGLFASWYKDMPNAEPGTHDFILKLADLIVNQKSFEHRFSKRLTHYKVVEAEDDVSKA